MPLRPAPCAPCAPVPCSQRCLWLACAQTVLLGRQCLYAACVCALALFFRFASDITLRRPTAPLPLWCQRSWRLYAFAPCFSALVLTRGVIFGFFAPKKKGRAPRLSLFPFSTGTLARPCSRDLINRQSCRRGCSRLQHLSCAACPPQTWSSLEDRTCSTRSPLDSCDHVSTAHTARWQ